MQTAPRFEGAAGFGLYRFFLLFLCSLVLTGCPAPPPHYEDPPDLRRMPQDPLSYVAPENYHHVLLPPDVQQQRAAEFLDLFFLPWQPTWQPVPKAKAYWPLETFSKEVAFVALGRPRPADWLTDMSRQARFDSYPSLDQPGIILRNTDCRALPDRQPAFFDPQRAGEGYPFDYLQNSALWGGTPVRVLHRSADQAWLFVQSPLVYGWVKASDVALVDADFTAAYRTGSYVAMTRDRLPLVDEDGQFRLLGRIGSLYPLLDGGESLQVPAAAADGWAVLRKVTLPPAGVSPFPLEASEENLALTARELLNEPYGWGGLNLTRDCSAMTRDLLAPFGIWLPRNSRQQARAGEMIDLAGLSPTDKEQLIISQGIPFLTLLYRPGHIMLYLGTAQNDGVIMHDLWGLKTRTCCGEGRRVIGRAVITSLHPGAGVAELARPQGELLPALKTMTIVGRVPYRWSESEESEQ